MAQKTFTDKLLERISKGTDIIEGQTVLMLTAKGQIFVSRVNKILPNTLPVAWDSYKATNRSLLSGGIMVDFFTPRYKINRRNCWKHLIVKPRGYKLLELHEITDKPDLIKMLDANQMKQIDFFSKKKIKR